MSQKNKQASCVCIQLECLHVTWHWARWTWRVSHYSAEAEVRLSGLRSLLQTILTQRLLFWRPLNQSRKASTTVLAWWILSAILLPPPRVDKKNLPISIVYIPSHLYHMLFELFKVRHIEQMIDRFMISAVLTSVLMCLTPFLVTECYEGHDRDPWDQ